MKDFKTIVANAHVNLRFGPETAMRLPEFLKEFGYTKAGLIFDVNLAKSEFFSQVRTNLVASGLVAHQLENRVSSPTYPDLDDHTDEFRSKDIDCLLAIGGGSTLDLAKGISVLLTNPGPGIIYRGVGKIKNPGVPLILIPTTAGTGSEVTPNASFIDPQEKKQLGINTEFYHPKLVILDPLLTISCPRSVTIGVAMDALVHHALDAFISGGWKNPLGSVFAKEAFRLIFNFLPKVLAEPENLEARGNLQLGAMFAGLALANHGGGSIAGAMSYPVGVHFHIHHGTAVAIFALESIRFNIERGFKGYADFAELIDAEGKQVEFDKSAFFYEKFSQFYAELEIPLLSKFGINEKDLSVLAEEISAMPVFKLNPIPVFKEDALKILKSRL